MIEIIDKPTDEEIKATFAENTRLRKEQAMSINAIDMREYPQLKFPKKKSAKPITATKAQQPEDIIGFGCYHTKTKRYDE